MKNQTSMLELVIVITLLLGCLPIFTQLVITCNKTNYMYMEDKSLQKLSAHLETDEIIINGTKLEIPIEFRRLNITLTDAMIIPFIQDDYCPTFGQSGQRCITSYVDKTTTMNELLYNGKPRHTTYSYYIERGNKARRTTKFIEWSSAMNNQTTSISDRWDIPVFLYWDRKNQHWILTTQNIPIM